MKHVRLEYSSVLGQFNKAEATDTPDVANGFKTLCCFVDTYRATSFIEAIQVKYPDLKKQNSRSYLMVSEMKQELFEFIEEDIKFLGQHMNTTFKRRQSLLNNNS